MEQVTELQIAVESNRLYDFVANDYYRLTKEELKEVLLGVLGVVYDNCKSEDDEVAFNNLLDTELKERGAYDD